jgi:hypothetical protein
VWTCAETRPTAGTRRRPARWLVDDAAIGERTVQSVSWRLTPDGAGPRVRLAAIVDSAGPPDRLLLLERHPIPAERAPLEEQPERLQILGVGAHRVRRTLDPRQPAQIAA